MDTLIQNFEKFLLSQNITTLDINNLKHTLLILLMLPIAITIYSILRHIIGLKNINLNFTILLSFSFIEFGYISYNNFNFWRGYVYGIILLINTLIVGAISYKVLKRFRLHYISKIAIIVTNVVITSSIIIILSLIIDRNRFVIVSPITIIIMILIVEEFITLFTKNRILKAIPIVIETIISATIIYLLISIDQFQTFILHYPYAIILVYIISFLIGQYKGLRLSEYWRFRTIIFKNESKDDQPSNNQKK